MDRAQTTNIAAGETNANGSGPNTPAVRSVRLALAALRLVAASDRALGVTEIARPIGVSPSTCYNVLKTLTAEQFLAFDSKTKKYTLGSGAIELSSQTNGVQRIFTNYRPKLVELATSLNVVVGFWEVRHQRLILSGVVESNAAIRIQMVPGTRLPLSAGAMGRVIAVELDLGGDELQAHIDQTRWHRTPRLTAYKREVAQARVSGWAPDEGEFIGGVATVASVVAAASGDPRLCITASGFTGQIDSARLSEIGEATHRIAAEIERDWFNRVPADASASTRAVSNGRR
jgi:DNA-binding IclR family transcriptional regulator